MSLRLRAGIWHIDLTHTDPATGERLRVRESTGTGDRRLAQARHASVQAALFRGDYVPQAHAAGHTTGGRVLSIAKAADRWMEVHLAGRARSTHDAAAYALRAIEQAGILSLAEPVASVTEARLRDLMAHWIHAGLSPATIDQRMWVLKGALKAAKDLGAVKVVPAVPKAPRERTSRAQAVAVKVFTYDDERRALDAMVRDERYADLHDFFVVAIDTGCRLSEVVGMRAADLDRSGGRRMVVRGKGDKLRAVPLTDRALATIRRRTQADPEGRMFVRPKGAASRYWQLRLEWLWAGLRDAIGLGHLTLHSTRHTCGSRLVAAGVNLRAVQAIMGHESITTTEIYLSVIDSSHDDVASALEAFNAARGGDASAPVRVVTGAVGTR